MPRVAVTMDYETFTDRRGAPAARYETPAPYVAALNDAGAQAVLLPHQAPLADVAALLDGCGGLVVAGGDLDVPPSYYGQAPRPGLGRLIEARSAFERSLLTTALARRMPVLGICGGMQLLWIISGGSMYQDIAERPGSDNHQQAHDKRQPAHAVTVAANSLLAAAYGNASQLQVNSTHHQVVDACDGPVRVTGTAPDGVVEAIERTDHPFAVGVQWHPEALLDRAAWGIYRSLVAAATGYCAAL